MSDTSAVPRIGLALGGGGARGLAHIPVLEALDELGIKPALIAGTSIGAIFGAAYASGLSGREIRQIVLETLSDNKAVAARLWQLRPRKLSRMFRPGPVQFDPERVLDVFVASHLPEKFSDLKIPLRLLATDFYGCREVDLESGPLLQAIAASIAIPAIFRPVQINGRVLIDGGVVNPLPFDGLRASCDIVLAVDVVGAPVPGSDPGKVNLLDSLFGSTQILMQTITTQKLKIEQPDILLRSPNDTVRVLDFLKAKHILDSADFLRKVTKERLGEMLKQPMDVT